MTGELKPGMWYSSFSELMWEGMAMMLKTWNQKGGEKKAKINKRGYKNGCTVKGYKSNKTAMDK